MILRICVVVPTFDNPRTISSVVKDIVTHTPFPVLVVDDGSETPVNHVLYSYEVREALEEGRVRVVRFEQNRGKGKALQFAIHDLIGRGFTHMFSVDADGQHTAREMAKLVDLAKKHPWDLIVGHRRLHSAPVISKFGRFVSNFWVSYQTGLDIRDSQSGFRLYPLFPLQTMKFKAGRYDFETEILVRMLWRGVGVREVDVDVVHPQGEGKVSHFHSFKDNARLLFLNIMLVAVSLLRSHRDPARLSLAAGLGVFIGCSPLFGLHTALAAAVAFGLRLNVVAVWLGTHVSLPPMVPLLIIASVYMGKDVLGISNTGGVMGHFHQWLIGSVALGALLGLVTGLTLYAVLKLKERGLAHSSSGISGVRIVGVRALSFVIKHFGLRAGYWCVHLLAPLFWFFQSRARRGIGEYYNVTQPELKWWARQKAVFHHFYLFGQMLVDRVHQSFHKDPQFDIRANGMRYLGEITGGQIVLSAHLGGWDLAVSLLGQSHITDHMQVVDDGPKGPAFCGTADRMDPLYLCGMKGRRTENATFEIHQALGEGRCLALMGDRPIGDRFELVPFMGRLAPFDVTAFRLAEAVKVPLLTAYGFKSSSGGYEFYARPPRLFQFGAELSRDEQLFSWAQEYAQDLEIFVRKHPDQWFNFFLFWSTPPRTHDGRVVAQSNNHLIQDLRRSVHRPKRAPSSPAPSIEA